MRVDLSQLLDGGRQAQRRGHAALSSKHNALGRLDAHSGTAQLQSENESRQHKIEETTEQRKVRN
jgi:hypothetical protein